MKSAPVGINIVDWFNIRDPKHLKALGHYNHYTRWPRGFIPKDIFFSAGWKARIEHKIAIAWILQYGYY